MDKIELTYKDADYIANVIRAQVNDLDIAYKAALEEGNKRTEFAKQIVQSTFPDDEELNKQFEDIEKTKTKAINELEQKYQDKLEKYERILELLMTGSL